MHGTLKLPEKNIHKAFSNISSVNVFLGQYIKTKEIKAKINKRNLIKHKFCISKKPINKAKTAYGLGENICK